MTDKIGKGLSDLVKWTMLIAIAAAALYLVCMLTLEQFCPKYQFSEITLLPKYSDGKWTGKHAVLAVRCNRVTGDIDVVTVLCNPIKIDKTGKWVDADSPKYEFIPLEPAK